MPTMVSGQVTSASSSSTAINEIDMDDVIHLLPVDQSPLAYVMQFGNAGSLKGKMPVQPGVYDGVSLKKEACKNWKTEWLEDELDPRTDAVNYSTGYGTTAQTFAVDDGTKFIAGFVVKNQRTGEVMRVESVSSNNVVFTRNLNANGSGFSVTDNDELHIIGNAQAEGSGSPTALRTAPSAKYNYTQIFKTAIDITGTELASSNYGGNQRAREQQKKGYEFLQDIERALLFGVRSRSTSSGVVNTMGGVTQYVTTNVTDIAGASLTESAWETWLRNVFTNGGAGERWVFASRIVNQAVSTFAKDRIMTRSGDEKFGLAITKYVTANGTVNIVPEPLFKGSVASGVGGHAYALDMSGVQLNYLEGNGENRTLKLQLDVQNNDVDGHKDQWFGEISARIMNEARHGILQHANL